MIAEASTLVALLLDAVELERGRKFYAKVDARLADSATIGDYSLSLWFYPEADVYEVVINKVGHAWDTPEAQNAQVTPGVIPVKKLAAKLNDWLRIRGHLAVTSYNASHLGKYRRLFSRLPGVKIVDVERKLVTGDTGFYAVTYDSPERLLPL